MKLIKFITFIPKKIISDISKMKTLSLENKVMLNELKVYDKLIADSKECLKK